MRNKYFHDYIVDAASELTPAIRISPFQNENLCVPKCSEDIAKEYLNSRFLNYIITVKGREAIDIALSHYKLDRDDIVSIVTTSENFYISSCVTKCIEKYCSWSRVISDRTKVIFVNHEFGYPHEQLRKLQSYGLPIIEDCAHAFISEDSESLIGHIGDFVIYSLPKFFPMQIGGLLVSDKHDVSRHDYLDEDTRKNILKHLSSNIPAIDTFIKVRLKNYEYLCEQLSPIGICPFFNLGENVVPGVFLFKWLPNINYPALKEFMQRNGVESSVFYGQNAFYIPIHQNLDQNQLNFFSE